MKDKKYCIYGAGGFGREALVCHRDSLGVSQKELSSSTVFMVDDEYFNTKEVDHVSVIKFSNFDPALYKVIVAIGDPKLRKNAIDKLPVNTEFFTIIHPSAVISETVVIGEGSIITAGVVLTTNIRIGKHNYLNLNVTVSHDCRFKDFITVASGVNISGNCHLGECVNLGANSCLREGIKISSGATVGMGGVVVKDILDDKVYIGNPAKVTVSS